MFQASRAPLYKYDANSTDNALTGEYGGYGEDQAYSVQADAVVGATQITLMKFNDIKNDAHPVNRVLSDDVAEPAHLFCVGQSIIVKNTNGDDMEMVIQEVSINGDNRIVLTVPALAEAVDANDLINIVLIGVIESIFNQAEEPKLDSILFKSNSNYASLVLSINRSSVKSCTQRLGEN